jgi:hypothetical protein
MNKISSTKFLPSSSSTSIVAISGKKITALSTDKRKINFEKFVDDVQEKVSKKKTTSGSNLKLINHELIMIKKTLNKEKVEDKKQNNVKRILREKTGREKRESKLEGGLKLGSIGKNIASKLTSNSIFDAIQKFISNILLGKLVIFLLENVDKVFEFLKFVGGATAFIYDLGTKVFGGIVGLIEGAYDINETIKGEVESVGGKKAGKEYDKFTGAFNKFINLAIILAASGVPLNLGGGKDPLKKIPKGTLNQAAKTVSTSTKPFAGFSRTSGTFGAGNKRSSIAEYLKRSRAEKLIERRYGNAAAMRYSNAYRNAIDAGRSPSQAAIRARATLQSSLRKGTIIARPAGYGLRGGTQARGLTGGIMRRGIGRAGSRLQTRIMGRSARLGANRIGMRAASMYSRYMNSMLGRIPILGALLVGVNTYFEDADGDGEPDKKLDKTLFKMGGAALGGFLGSFIPIPFLGTMLGLAVGEYVGDLFYTLVRGGGVTAVGDKLKKDIEKLINGATLVKDWLLNGVQNIAKDTRFNIPGQGLIERTLKIKFGAWPTLLNPLNFNVFQKLDILREAFLVDKNKSMAPATGFGAGSTPGGGGRRSVTAQSLGFTPAQVRNLKSITPGAVPSLAQWKKTVKGSIFEPVAEEVYNTALAEGVNPAFIWGLSGAEQSHQPFLKNNPWNYGVHQNMTFNSLAEGVRVVARALRDPKGYYVGAGHTTLQGIMSVYTPDGAEGNNTRQHIKNIINIGSQTKGDPSTVLIPLNYRPGTSQTSPSTSLLPSITQPAGTIPPSTVQNNGQNGRLKRSQLTRVGPLSSPPDGGPYWYGNGAYLAHAAAKWFIKAKQAAQKEGVSFVINSAYRSYEHQQALVGIYSVVAAPGTSSHGWGTAVDLQTGTSGYEWMVNNGPNYGWYYMKIPNDPVHFEFRGAPALAPEQPQPAAVPVNPTTGMLPVEKWGTGGITPEGTRPITRNAARKESLKVSLEKFFKAKAGSNYKLVIPELGLVLVKGKGYFGGNQTQIWTRKTGGTISELGKLIFDGTDEEVQAEIFKKLQERGLFSVPPKPKATLSPTRPQPGQTYDKNGMPVSFNPQINSTNKTQMTASLRQTTSYDKGAQTLVFIQPIETVVTEQSSDPLGFMV